MLLNVLYESIISQCAALWMHRDICACADVCVCVFVAIRPNTLSVSLQTFVLIKLRIYL